MRSLTPDKEVDPEVKNQQVSFIEQAYINLGLVAKVTDFPEEALTPENDYYEDDEEGFEGTPDEILSPTPEVNDNYVVMHI